MTDNIISQIIKIFGGSKKYSIDSFWSEIKEIKTISHNQLEEKHEANELCQYFSEKESIAKVTFEAIKDNQVSIKSSIDRYVCKKTIYCNHTNYMIFTNSDGKISYIYISGFYSSFSLVNIEKQEIYCIFGSKQSSVSAYTRLLEYVRDNISDVTKYLDKKDHVEFGGILISNPRPFHFFYDLLPGLEIIIKEKENSNNWEKKELDIFFDPESSFIHPNTLFRSGCKIEAARDLEAFSIRNKNKFYISPAINYNFIKEDDELRESIDSKIRSYPPQKNLEFIEKTSPAEREGNKGSILIWIGITSQKRVWLNQEECIISILNTLSDIQKNVTVLFDGWTSCIEPSKADIINSDSDTLIYESIASKLSTKIKTINLIGMSSNEKVTYGNLADIFIANHSAGSLHISRICKKSGISHINTAMEHDYQWHYDVEPLPRHCIENVLDNKNNTIGAIGVDYNVEFRCLSTVFFRKLKELKLLPSKSSVESLVLKATSNYNNIISKKTNLAPFRNLKIKPNSESPDILRDIAIAFEMVGDIKTSYTVMSIARELRPAGPFINKKLNEYKTILMKDKN